jgi:hypothetical protein
VLDDEKCDAMVATLLLDVLGELPHQRPVDTSRGLIEQDQARRNHQRPSEFQQLPLAAGEVGRVRVAQMQEVDIGQHPERLVDDDVFLSPDLPGPEPGVPDSLSRLILAGKNQVFQHRHGRDRAWDLEGAGDSAPQQLIWPQSVYRLAREED